MKQVHQSTWCVAEPPEIECGRLADSCGISVFLAKILWNRGLQTPEDVHAFFNLDHAQIAPSDLLPDLAAALDRLERAIQNRESVLVFGDYDVDGITSTVLLYSYLKDHGADVSYYIPTRSGEGYGLNEDAVRRYAAEGVTLLLTVDSGVTAFEEVALCNQLGMDVVITDHHRCRKTLPEALAVVNPMREDSEYPYPALAGVGVVFKLLCALHARLTGLDFHLAAEEMSARYIEFVAIGTVADVMPLIGENRLFVKRGLLALPNTKNLGLSALLKEIFPQDGSGHEAKYNSGTIGFLIAPRINAAGRVGSAMRAVELFLTEDPDTAKALAVELCEENKHRQVAESLIFEEALSALEEHHRPENDLFLIEDNPHWHQGVVGIVASRLCERFHRPCILFSYPDGENGPAKGSGRSVKGFNLVEALASCEPLLLKYGGHELAAGVTVEKENLPALQRALNDYAREHLKEEDLIAKREVDFVLRDADVTLENATELLKLEPFGMKNPKPLFLLPDALVESIYPVGNGRHSKLQLNVNGQSVPALYFNHAPVQLPILRGEKGDFLCTLDLNTYLGSTSVQLGIKDLRPAKSLCADCTAQYQLYLDRKAGKEPYPEVPSRKEFEMVFRQIKGVYKSQPVDLHFFSRRIGMPFSRLLMILDIFEEAGILSRVSEAPCRFAELELLPRPNGKADLETTPTYLAATGHKGI